MNKERMMELADFIEGLEFVHSDHIWKTLPEHKNRVVFNMHLWEDKKDCGTVCCIGGSSKILFGGHITTDLDITGEEKKNLCYPPTLSNWDKITPQIAAQTLRLIANGVLDIDKNLWPSALELLGEQALQENKYKN